MRSIRFGLFSRGLKGRRIWDEFIFTLIYIIPSGVEDEVVFDIKFLKFLNTFIFPKMAVVKPSKIYIDVLHILASTSTFSNYRFHC